MINLFSRQIEIEFFEFVDEVKLLVFDRVPSCFLTICTRFVS